MKLRHIHRLRLYWKIIDRIWKLYYNISRNLKGGFVMKDITRCKKDREGGCFIVGKIDEGKYIDQKDVHSI